MTKNKYSSNVLSRFVLGTSFALLTVVAFSAPTFAKADTLYRELEVGSTGSDVGSLQSFLAQDTTLYPRGLVTNYFGSLTKAAVANFQSRNNIAAVGRVGPITLPVLNMQMAGGVNNSSNQSAPVISVVSVNTTNSSATLSWSTNENASAIVYYSVSPIVMTEGSSQMGVSISGTSVLAHVSLQTSHGVNITNLQSQTTYNYVVYVRDGSGNESITWPSTFRTN